MTKTTGLEDILKFTAVSLLLGTLAVHAAGNTNVVVMLGDSTTQCSRNKPGANLTDYVQTYLTRENVPVKIVNSGRGSDTAKGGFGRLQKAVLAHAPAVVTISFGLNDAGLFTPRGNTGSGWRRSCRPSRQNLKQKSCL